MDTAQISGKVFRFLSAMHPSLSKSERKRYAGFDPDRFYPWTDEVAAEFTDLMRRSPRDTSFARGFAYVAEKGLPEGEYVPAAELLANLAGLPAAYGSPEGSGFEVEMTGELSAVVTYRGMPGFTNVCIAVTGELEQRLKDSGARGGEVRHGKVCRLHGGDSCQFEVSWSDTIVPSGATAADLGKLLGEVAEVAAPKVEPTPEPAPEAAPQPEPAARVAPAARREPRAKPVARASSEPDASSQDLFAQLKGRLEEAERQAEVHAELEAEIDRLQVELDQVRADGESRVAAAVRQTESTRAELDELKRKIRDLVGTS